MNEQHNPITKNLKNRGKKPKKFSKYRPQSDVISSKIVNNNKQYKSRGQVALTRTSANPMSLRGNDRKHTIELAQKFRTLKLVEYLYGAIHPREAVSKGLDVKMPSDLPIPTACIRVTQTISITTGANGILCVNYCPGTLIAAKQTLATASTLSVNTTGDGLGSAGTNSFVTVPFAQIAEVYDRWRLTAAEMTLSYNGPLLSQAGVMSSAVHYEPVGYATKGVSGSGTIAGTANANIDRFSGNHQVVKNGLWNTEVNIANDSHGITHVHTPTSVDDYAFSGYYSTSPTTTDVSIANQRVTIPNVTAASSGTTQASTARSYVWVARNLPPNTACMIFTINEIYEFLPEIGSVPILSLNNDSVGHDEYAPILNLSKRNASIKRKGLPWEKIKDVASSMIEKFASKVDVPKLLTGIAGMLL